MNVLKMMSIVMIVAGTQGLVYGGLYRLDAIETIGTESQEAANAFVVMPSWAGLAAVTVGGALFFAGRKRRRGSDSMSGKG